MAPQSSVATFPYHYLVLTLLWYAILLSFLMGPLSPVKGKTQAQQVPKRQL